MIEVIKSRNNFFGNLNVHDKFITVSKHGEFIKCKKISLNEAKYRSPIGFWISEVNDDQPVIKI